MTAALARYREGNPSAARELQPLAEDARPAYRKREYRSLSSDGEHLADDRIEAIEKRVDAIEEEKIGVGRPETFHKMLEELEDIYLRQKTLICERRTGASDRNRAPVT